VIDVRLKNKVVLITGKSRGIEKVIAELLHKKKLLKQVL